MSHVVSVQTQIRDPAALAAACSRLGLPAPVEGAAQLYSGEVRGVIVSLPGWQYPIVLDVASGHIHYDNFGGQWGDPACLDRLIQAYAVEKTRIEARRRGCSVSEQILEDGSIKLHISNL